VNQRGLVGGGAKPELPIQGGRTMLELQ